MTTPCISRANLIIIVVGQRFGQLSLARLKSLDLVNDECSRATTSESMTWVSELLRNTTLPALRKVKIRFTSWRTCGIAAPMSYDSAEMSAAWTAVDAVLLESNLESVQISLPGARANRAPILTTAVQKLLPRLHSRIPIELDQHTCECRFVSNRSWLLTHGNLADDSSLAVGHDFPVTALTTSLDGRWFASGSADATIILWNAHDGTIFRDWTAHDITDGAISSLAFSPTGRELASSSANNPRILIWNVVQGGLIGTLSGHSSPVRTCAWSPDGALVVTGSQHGTVRLWDARTYSAMDMPIHSSREDREAITFLSFDPHGLWLVVGMGRQCDVWTVPAFALRKTLRGHTGTIRTAAFDSSGMYLATASDDYTVRIWGLERPEDESLKVLRGHLDDVRDVAFSPDGTLVASASDDGTVLVRSICQESSTVVLEGHSSMVYAARFSPRGEYLASASADGTVRMWRLNDWSCATIFEEHRGQVTHLEFSRDGAVLCSCADDGTVCIQSIQ